MSGTLSSDASTSEAATSDTLSSASSIAARISSSVAAHTATIVQFEGLYQRACSPDEQCPTIGQEAQEGSYVGDGQRRRSWTYVDQKFDPG